MSEIRGGKVADVNQGHWPAEFPATSELARYWGRECRYKPGHNADRASLLTLDDVRAVLADGRARYPHFILFADGRPVEPRQYLAARNVGGSLGMDFLNLRAVHRFLSSGASLKLSSLDDYWSRAASLRSAVQAQMGTTTGVAAIVSPPGQGAFVLHQDVEHVLVLQTSGSKRWKVYDRFPGQDATGSVSLPEGVSPVLDITMSAGDVLYVPSGLPHVAQCADEWSVHVTFSVKPVTAADVLRPRVEELLRRFTMTVVGGGPFGTADGEGEAAVAQVAKQLAAELLETQWRMPAPVAAGSRPGAEQLTTLFE